ncbi:autotransporter outer membrane beta-barrel domain-containing protein [Martelella mediterranea]|uniref:Autotransporter domain-containing protein n=1 Tax=Martelella mediterranea TaxID=293089 RepID=A0A4V2V3J1_9HYPH|nr:autotransporter outer membrane beta-barrel domain-containing protein [Martelella mediterranea]TCT33014.1 hypothetical protein EDC90_10364 [Martelella mediterranea]
MVAEKQHAPSANLSVSKQDRKQVCRKGRWIASSVLFHTTALAGTLAGVPVPFYARGYVRAYAQAVCNPSSTANYINADISKTTFSCTISSSSTVETPQYAYGGSYTFYQSLRDISIAGYYNVRYYKRQVSPQQGLNISINNNADIRVGASTETQSIITTSTASKYLYGMGATQSGGISAVSRGGNNWNPVYSSNADSYKDLGGDGGAVTITSSGSVTSTVGGGIYALSRAGDAIAAVYGADGGAVNVTVSGDVNGATSGVVAISQAGVSSDIVYPGSGTSSPTAAGTGGDVTVQIYGSVSATQAGPAVLAASYGGHTKRAENVLSRLAYVEYCCAPVDLGSGGNGGSATLQLGSSEKAFSGKISSVASGSIGKHTVARSSGAALSAISLGGNGVYFYSDYSGVSYFGSGGDAGEAKIEITATSEAQIETKGDASPAILVQSAGGRAAKGGNYSFVGGDGGSVYSTLQGGGAIQTSGDSSIGIIAQSLGGSGRSTLDNSSYGQAGSGGKVNVTTDFAITTNGNYAHGILAQSAASAYGYGIFSFSGDGKVVWGDTSSSSTGSSAVVVTNHGSIETYGVDAHGIVAQSIGGGGGLLTSTAALSANQNGALTTSNYQTIGGGAGSADGANVEVTNYGSISTHGGTSETASDTEQKVVLSGGIAILAQSIGGGGGNNNGSGAIGSIGGDSGSSGGSGSNGGTVTVSNSGALTTAGPEAHGIVAQSIGGGGGTGRNGNGFFFTVGGTGGGGGDGGEITITNAAKIITSGDHASGVIAQSIGGGGGQGGSATSWGLGFSSAVGGSGGQGGDGGTVTFTENSSNYISTKGYNAPGIVLQSIGGGGGTGGAAKSYSTAPLFSMSFATGGTGGEGGKGGDVYGHSAGTVKTAGTDSPAVVVQSIGGGGGQGGSASAKAMAIGIPISESLKSISFSVAVAHGGKAGAGGDGGTAQGFVDPGALIKTYGDGAVGMIVQSIGGGGGQGGDSTAAAGAASIQGLLDTISDGTAELSGENIGLNLDFSHGGSGGSGGSGGFAYGHIEGALQTAGNFADGLIVQSIGGGGGHGGAGESDSITTFGDSTFTLGVSLGGSAGNGGSGGVAKGGLRTGASIVTSGPNSNALVVHSIGGGGGIGGGGSGDLDADTTISIGLGATGGDGGTGRSVYAWNGGTITTSGDSSSGIVAQSIGGGGGLGGSGTSSVSHSGALGEREKSVLEKEAEEGPKVEAKFDITIKNSMNVKTGADGGVGGDGGAVYVGIGSAGGDKISGTTKTEGSFSEGVLAQSIGGGGGQAGVSSNKSMSGASFLQQSISVPLFTVSSVEKNSSGLYIGASNGSAGSGGPVTVYASNISTSGFGSNGVLAQSVGGGGGKALSTGYAVKDVYVKFGSTGESSDDRDAGSVNIQTLTDTKIVTTGDNANAILAQSIGGGGGFAGIALGNYNTVSDESISGVISSTFGGGSDNGNADGKDVSINHYGYISTTGKRSIGIAGQSISGGGGFLTAAANNFDNAGFVQKQAPASADKVDIAVKENASIVTSGDGAFGILAQTVSGGGGVSADLAQKLNAYYRNYGQLFENSDQYYGGKSGNAEQTGYVTVTVDGSVSTSGKYAHGIVAQAVGGSGGIFLQNGKTYAGTLANFNNEQDPKVSGNVQSGNLEVTINGSVEVSDPTSWGVWAQATGVSMTLTVGNDGVLSGSTAAASNGDYNGGAVYSSGADRTVLMQYNHGTVTGNVVRHRFSSSASAADGVVRTTASAGSNLFVNQGTGTFVTGHIADAGGILNAGNINPGGEWNTIQTRVTGDLLGIGTFDSGSAYDASDLGLSGTFSPFSYFKRSNRIDWRTENSSKGGLLTGLDVDMENDTADKVLVEGDFAGTWGIDVNANALLPHRRTEFLTTKGEDTGTFSALSSLVFDFTDVTKSEDGWHGFSVDDAHFVGNGVSLGRNAGEVSRAMQQAWDKISDGSSAEIRFADDEISLGQAFGAFHQAEPETFSDMLLELASQTAAAPLVVSPSAAITAANSVLSCPAFETTGVMMDEGSCVWSRVLGGETTQTGHGDSSGFTKSVGGLQFGGQKALDEGWFLGGGLTYESSWFRNDAGSEKMEQQSFTGAVALKKEMGPWLFGLVGGAGYNWGESKRYINLDRLSATARGEPDSAMLFARARASYQFGFDDQYYMRPKVDLDVINMHQYGYTEAGAGALNLIVDGHSDTAFGITPGVEFGARIPFMEDWPARLYGDIGVSFLTSDEWETTARFAGLSSMDSFSTFSPIADTVGHVSLGLDLAKRQGMELKFEYNGSFAEDYQSHIGSLRFGYRF